MKGQIINDVIVVFGSYLSGDNIFDIPDDYSPERYQYTPSVPGVFDPDGFNPIDPPIITIKTWISEQRSNIIDIQIQDGRAVFVSSVMGQINDTIELAEVVDDTRLHLHLTNAVFLISVQQYTFNGQTFDTSLDAVDFISNL